jgi:DNA-binding transcriptional ArsR family regulator
MSAAPRLERALSHPLRVRILGILEEQTTSAVEISRTLGAEIGVVSYHIRTLHRLGLLELVRETPRRGAIQRYYRARPRPNAARLDWAGEEPADVGAALQQIDEVARAANAVGGFDRPGARFERTVLKVDAQGLQRLTESLTRTLDAIQEIERESERRQAEADPPGSETVGLVMMMFGAPARASGHVPADSPRSQA